MTGFTPRTWVNDGAPAINAANLQAMDNGIEDAHDEIQVIEDDINYPSTVKQKAIADSGEDGGVEGGVINGDFEYGEGSQSSDDFIGDKKYGWWLNATGNVVASFDSSVHHSGNQSLKIDLTDASAIGIVSRNITENLVFQVKSSTVYKMSAWIKTNNAATNSVWFTSTQYDSDGGIIAGTWTAGTSPKLSGTNDWTYVEKIITTHADAVEIDTQLYHGVAGNVADAWFDNIKIEQIDTQVVNTQVVTPASVSVEGVTTTDNVDQSQTSGTLFIGSTYVGHTQGQTFTPTEERHTSVDIYLAIAGDYGVATLFIYEWDTDYATTISGDAIASIIHSTLVNNQYNTFELPCILDTTKQYLYHATGTGVDVDNVWKPRGNTTSDDYAGGQSYSDGSAINYDWNFIQSFAKHTESPIIEANGSALDLTGVKLLTGATVTVNVDGSGECVWEAPAFGAYVPDILEFITGNAVECAPTFSSSKSLAATVGGEYIIDFGAPCVVIDGTYSYAMSVSAGRSGDISVSDDKEIWEAFSYTDADNGSSFSIPYKRYVKVGNIVGGWLYFTDFTASVNLDCTSAQLPTFAPSSEVSSETQDLVLNPIDISEDQLWQLKYDLTGWGSRTITMVADEATWEAQAVSANTIYVYDSNGTTPWTWDAQNGLVPPADRTSGAVMAKFNVGDNQIRSSVNNGSMKANVNLSWNEESVRAAINRLTAIANLMYPIVVEVEDVPEIDLQSAPSGASAATGYTNDIDSVRQSVAATPAIIYTGLLPRENRFSEWLDIEVICDDGDGVLQGKLYTVDGTLIETYADLEANPVLTLSNPDYKYSRERMLLQISASTETTSTAWSVTKVVWRYQYNG